MVERGDIMVERLTGRRAIVIDALGPEEVTCRFSDGRLEGRFTFELESLRSALNRLWSWIVSLFVAPSRPETVAVTPEGLWRLVMPFAA